MSDLEGAVLDYIWQLIFFTILIPVLIGILLSGFLHIEDPWLSILITMGNFVVMYVIKRILRDEYPEIFENVFSMILTSGVVFLILYTLRGSFGISTFSAIGTTCGIILAYFAASNR